MKKRYGAKHLLQNRNGKQKGPGGKKLCRWCGIEVPGRRRTWCSQACVDEYLVRQSGSYARKKVRERDNAICACCGLDTSWLRKVLSRGPLKAQRSRMRILGLKPSSHVRTLWEMDHIIPVAEGGGVCGLDNLRTLCIWHHRAETRKLQARLAAKRKLAAVKPKKPSLFNR